MKQTRSTYLALIAMLLSPMAVHADPISLDLDVFATDWTLNFGDGSVTPIDPLEIIFSVDLDNSADISASTAGLFVESFNLPYAVQYAYSAANDILSIASDPVLGGCGNPPSSWCMFIGSVSSSPNVFFVQQSTSVNGYWTADTIEYSVAVPEPGTLALLGIGLFGMGLARRRRKV